MPDFTAPAPQWALDRMTLDDLFRHSRALLYLHGFLSEAENSQVLRRLDKSRRRHAATVAGQISPAGTEH